MPFFLIIIFPKLVQWCFCCIFKYNHTVIIILVNHNLYISWHIDKVQLSVSSYQEFTQRALTRALTESSLPGILNHNENWQTMLLFCIQNATIKHAQAEKEFQKTKKYILLLRKRLSKLNQRYETAGTVSQKRGVAHAFG